MFTVVFCFRALCASTLSLASLKMSSSTATPPRHVLLENHPLIYDKLGPPRTPSSEEIKLICQIFDGAGVFEVSLDAPFLIIRCRSLPPRPWPITIGGIPIWLTESATDSPIAQGEAGLSQPVLTDLNLSQVYCPPSETVPLIVK